MSKRLTLFDLFKAKDEGRQLTQVFTIDVVTGYLLPISL